MQAKDMLPDHLNERDFEGVIVRKGTVGAFIVSARTWLDADAAPADRAIAEQDIVAAVPALRALGVLEVLTVRDPHLRRLVEGE
ncbi:hypothetical protein [Pseudoduganella sp. R-34]|uniref:hypothetical protein n=1 Tax=unclassified Pseudoduganella TaxID=2637179 RepID=UPI003CF53F8D